jgi:hypothetical protein
VEACLIAPGSFRAVRENARARRARGAIAELGGLLAERRPTVGTDSGDSILRAARRAFRDARDHVDRGNIDGTEALLKAIRQAEHELHRASAYMRQAYRPLSVSGFGEEMDQLQDIVDRAWLRRDPPGDDEEDETALEDEQWEAFVEEHPELDDLEADDA